ncbi:MAG: hypothetical protein IPI67_32325 [Myxococcales bacterium]|nr:hypothetical protein [Myxococcales bacterium]
MPFRAKIALLIALLVALVGGSAAAAKSRDVAAKKQIDEAINEHYVTTNFNRAEKVLLGAIKTCGGQCSPAVTAKAWMYIGIVRGSGKNDQKGAREAFVNAIASDAGVELDAALATPQTKKTFNAIKRTRPSGVSSPSETDSVDLEEPESTGGSMDCSLKVTEVQTRRPIPIACRGGEGAKKIDLRYKFGGGGWKTLKMKKKRGALQATIPCKDLQRKGTLRFYVRGVDGNGDPVDGYAKKSKPIEIDIVKRTEEEPPSFPDKAPPGRCPQSEETEAADCESSDDCDGGLSCNEGKCAAAKKKHGAAKESWLGLHFAYDFAFTGGKEVCSQESQLNNGFACYHQDTEEQYRFDPHPTYADEIKSGIAPATARALISFDQLATPNLSVGARVGYAFGGGPPSGKKKDAKFLPFHAELRGSYWFGDKPFADSGLRPYVGAQGGAAQVDAKLPVKIGDCAGVPGGPASKPGATIAKDGAYYDACKRGNAPPVPLKLDAYKKLGKAFIGLHAGIVYAVSADSGLQLNVNFMQMLPTSGQVIEPSLGYVVGL